MINIMLDKTLKVLNDILIDFSTKFYFHEKLNNKGDVLNLKKDLSTLINSVFSVNSKLLLLNQLIKEFLKECNDTKYNYYVHESRDALKYYDFKYFIYGSWQKYVDSLPDDESKMLADVYNTEYTPSVNKYNYYKTLLAKNSSFSKLKNIYFEIITRYARDIDMIAYDNFKIRDPYVISREFVAEYNSSTLYIETWIKGEITLDIWCKNPDTRFLYEMQFFYSEKDINAVNKNQLKLYWQAIDIELESLKKYILESSSSIQLSNVERQLNLIQKFLSGNYSALDYIRLSNIIKFDRPDEVILAYDDIIRFEIYDYSKILPYDGLNLRKSSRFVADLLIKYNDFLSERMNILSTKKKSKKEDVVVKPKPKSFGFINPKKQAALKSVLQQLQYKYNLIQNIDENVDDLVMILTTNDYSTIPYNIHINCNTNLFTYVLREIKCYFNYLTSINIEASGKFYTKNSNLLSSSNFNKGSNNLSIQKKEEINKIIIKLKQ
jgi:hypothetical protein